jgi:DHA2 family multidrug resistance protein
MRRPDSCSIVETRDESRTQDLGLHVTKSGLLTDQRLQDYAHAVAARSVGQTGANGRATALLAHAVQNQAYVLAFIDAFMILGYAVIGALLLILLLRKPPAGSLFGGPA